MSAPSITLESVLESVVAITEQRSRENLESCLVKTLAELTDLDRIDIARPTRRSGCDVLEFFASAHHGKPMAPTDILAPIDATSLVGRALAARTDVIGKRPDGSWQCCLPVVNADSEILAVVIVERGRDPSDHLPLIRGIAGVYRNYLAILQDAERDTLTGLRNRKTFDENLERVIATVRGRQRPPGSDRRHHGEDEHNWLGICDIDHFKRINDTYGHVFGDEVLLLFAAIMRKVFRTEDLLFRFGGEEFVVVLAPTTSDNAAKVFERFRMTVEAFSFPQVGSVTVSVGFVKIDSDDVHATVLGRADTALYWSKNNGRNRVCHYEDLVRDGRIAAPVTLDDAELF